MTDDKLRAAAELVVRAEPVLDEIELGVVLHDSAVGCEQHAPYRLGHDLGPVTVHRMQGKRILAHPRVRAALAASATDEQGRLEERYWTAYDAASATDEGPTVGHELWCGLDWNTGKGCTCRPAVPEALREIVWSAQHDVTCDDGEPHPWTDHLPWDDPEDEAAAIIEADAIVRGVLAALRSKEPTEGMKCRRLGLWERWCATHEARWPMNAERCNVTLTDLRAALAASATDEGPTTSDLGSEYGRLLAERDRLIAAGVDQSALEVIDSLARPAVPEALDVERLARALFAVHAYPTLDEARELARDIAREYATLRAKEPTE